MKQGHKILMGILAISVIWLLTGTTAFTEIRVKVGGFSLPGLLDKQRGTQDLVLDEIISRLEKAGVILEFTILPPKRAIAYVQSGELDGYYPAIIRNVSLEFWKKLGHETPVIHTDPIFLVKDLFVISTQNDKPKLHTLEALSGKTVGIARGVSIAEELRLKEKKIRVELVNNGVQNIRKLSVGRIDATISFTAMLPSYISKAEVTNIHSGTPFGARKLGIGLRPDKRTKTLIREANRIIEEMIQDGSYCQIVNANSIIKGSSIVDCSAPGKSN